jgi:hypothetical protein
MARKRAQTAPRAAKKRGRKSVFEQKMTRVTMSIPHSYSRFVEDAAEASGQSVSHVLRVAIEQHAEAQGVEIK